MKSIFVFLTFLICSVAVSQTSKEKTTIIITKTTPYCGGANPPEQILEEARKKKIPFGEKFYIIKGTHNSLNRKITDTLVFDSSGKCSAILKPGCYSIINDFGFKRLQADTGLYDMDCLKKLWMTPLLVFKVVKGKSETFSYNIAEPCPHNKPCYKGEVALPM